VEAYVGDSATFTAGMVGNARYEPEEEWCVPWGEMRKT
jgi:hypothetical protein